MKHHSVQRFFDPYMGVNYVRSYRQQKASILFSYTYGRVITYTRLLLNIKAIQSSLLWIIFSIYSKKDFNEALMGILE